MQFVSFLNAKLLRPKLELLVIEIRFRARSKVNHIQMKIPKGRETIKSVNKGQRKSLHYFSVLYLWPKLFSLSLKEERFILLSVKKRNHKRLR